MTDDPAPSERHAASRDSDGSTTRPPDGDPQRTEHPAGEEQAAQNRDAEPPG